MTQRKVHCSSDVHRNTFSCLFTLALDRGLCCVHRHVQVKVTSRKRILKVHTDKNPKANVEGTTARFSTALAYLCLDVKTLDQRAPKPSTTTNEHGPAAEELRANGSIAKEEYAGACAESALSGSKRKSDADVAWELAQHGLVQMARPIGGHHDEGPRLLHATPVSQGLGHDFSVTRPTHTAAMRAQQRKVDEEDGRAELARQREQRRVLARSSPTARQTCP